VNASRTKTGWWFKTFFCGWRPQFEWIFSALYLDGKNACHPDPAATCTYRRTLATILIETK